MTERSFASAADELRRIVRGKVSAQAPLGPLTSFRIGGPAAILVEPDGEDDLSSAARVIKAHSLDCVVLGRGSNVLVSDEGFDGAVIRLSKGFEWIRASGHGVEAGSGAALPRVSNFAARRSLAGLEFAVAIPATVGGGVRMNAGAHGRSMSEALEWARVCKLGDGSIETLGVAELGAAYRHTSLTGDDVVVAARFHLQPAPAEEILARMERYRAHRAATQPAEAPNAGSMFRNPPGGSAGRLIEAAGLKGIRLGGVEVSPKHGNFFLAHEGATAQQVHDLMAHVQRRVFDHSGTLLVPEVRLIGLFERAAELKGRGT